LPKQLSHIIVFDIDMLVLRWGRCW